MSSVPPANATSALAPAPVSHLVTLPPIPAKAPEPIMLAYRDLFKKAVDHDRADGLCGGPQWEKMVEVRVPPPL